jgi:hypothetical protein
VSVCSCRDAFLTDTIDAHPDAAVFSDDDAPSAESGGKEGA